MSKKSGSEELINNAKRASGMSMSAEVNRIIRQVDGEMNEEVTFTLGAQLKPSSNILGEISNIRRLLSESVFEQENAVEALCDALAKQIYQSNENAPAGVFLFIGPSASGKTLLAEKLAELLEGGIPCYTVNMATLTSNNQAFVLNGMSKGYADARPGELTSFVRENPRSVIIIDNIDMPHPNNLAVLEPILSSGSLKDEFGFSKDIGLKKPEIEPPLVCFRKTIVILTTNAGADAYEDLAFKSILKKNPDQVELLLLKELSNLSSNYGDKSDKQFSPSFIAGLATGSTILFNKLSLNTLAKIAQQKIMNATNKVSDDFECQFEVDRPEMLSKALVLSFAPEVDARTANNEVVQKLMDQLTDYARSHEGVMPKQVKFGLTVNALSNLKKILADYGDNDPLEQVFRKSQKLDLTIDTEESNGLLSILISKVELKRVPHALDFRGSGAIKAEIPEVSFADIAGHHIVKKRLLEVVELLKNPAKIKSWGVDVPKGMLLFGAPGTGKTMLAKALAHEADLPFISTTGSELLDLNFVQSIFKRAHKYAPSILFIDEFDAIGARGQGGIDFIINQLLIEIDGFDTSLSAPVFIIAATNLPGKIDTALVRSGRIDLKVEVPALDRGAREYFVNEYFKLPNDGTLDMNALLNHTAGMSGADLEMVKRETVLEMVSAGIEKVGMKLLTEQINTIKYGVRSTNSKRIEKLDSTAYHEAGHAIVSMVVNPDVLIEQVTVMPRENALGFVSYDVESMQHRKINRQEVLDNMCVALAGRIAQTRQFPEHGHDSGASSDLEKATNYAINAISRLGLDQVLGNIVLNMGQSNISSDAANMVFERVQVWLKEAEVACSRITEEHWGSIDSLAKRLIKDEVVTGAELIRDFGALVDVKALQQSPEKGDATI